ncbi:MAG: hypothetical protein J6M18_04655 [Actinomycetaceae bacterium]|nr:hypothetical protein [Actinomycetaceae bacterium]
MRRIRVAFLILFFSFATSGCSVVSKELNKYFVDMDSIVANDYMAVLPMCTNWKSSRFGTIDCYSIFFKPDGSWNLVKTNFIEYDKPLWNEEGLFLADLQHEYWFTDNSGVIIHDVKKEGLSRDASAYFNNMFFSLYNWGFSDDGNGYDYELVIGNKEKATRSVIPYFLEGNAVVCNGELFIPTNMHGHEGETNGGLSERFLQKLTSTGETEIVMRADSYDGDNGKSEIESMFERICDEEGVIRNLVMVSPVDDNGVESDFLYYALEVWNTTKKEHTIIPLAFDDGEKINARIYDFAEVRYIKDNYIYVTADQGVIFRIDMTSGLTECVSEPVEKLDINKNYRYSFEYDSVGNEIYQFVTDSERVNDPYIRIVDMESGKELERIVYPNLNLAMEQFVPSSLVVNPNMSH